MAVETAEKHEMAYHNDDGVATQKDLKILGLEIDGKILNLKIELENKINSITIKLGSLIIASSGILFGLLSYFHK
jgi:hypothetical protein